MINIAPIQDADKAARLLPWVHTKSPRLDTKSRHAYASSFPLSLWCKLQLLILSGLFPSDPMDYFQVVYTFKDPFLVSCIASLLSGDSGACGAGFPSASAQSAKILIQRPVIESLSCSAVDPTPNVSSVTLFQGTMQSQFNAWYSRMAST